ncbi:zincin [Trametes cingulata]|nr:zincin [Trametes cingulata]
MHKTLLVLFWAGCLVGHELASIPDYDTELVHCAALVIATVLSIALPSVLHLHRPGTTGSSTFLSLGAPQSAVGIPVELSTANCTTSEIAAIQHAVALASEYVDDALVELRSTGPEGNTYRRWFGAPNNGRFSTVQSHFEALSRDDLSQYTYSCNPVACVEHGAEYAFVDYTITKVMNLCPSFFLAPDGGRNSRASTIVHEATHFYRNGFTSDHSRNAGEAERLARTYPHLAVSNAESYEYFAVDAHRSRGARAPGLPASRD